MENEDFKLLWLISCSHMSIITKGMFPSDCNTSEMGKQDMGGAFSCLHTSDRSGSHLKHVLLLFVSFANWRGKDLC